MDVVAAFTDDGIYKVLEPSKPVVIICGLLPAVLNPAMPCVYLTLPPVLMPFA